MSLAFDVDYWCCLLLLIIDVVYWCWYLMLSIYALSRLKGASRWIRICGKTWSKTRSLATLIWSKKCLFLRLSCKSPSLSSYSFSSWHFACVVILLQKEHVKLPKCPSSSHLSMEITMLSTLTGKDTSVWLFCFVLFSWCIVFSGQSLWC